MDTFAMWLGYAVMALVAIPVTFVIAVVIYTFFGTRRARKLSKDGKYVDMVHEGPTGI